MMNLAKVGHFPQDIGPNLGSSCPLIGDAPVEDIEYWSFGTGRGDPRDCPFLSGVRPLLTPPGPSIVGTPNAERKRKALPFHGGKKQPRRVTASNRALRKQFSDDHVAEKCAEAARGGGVQRPKWLFPPSTLNVGGRSSCLPARATLFRQRQRTTHGQ